MVESVTDARVDMVLRNIDTMVASEGGTIELISADSPTLQIRYLPGVNEECPECVPTHDAVTRFLSTALQIHAPEYTDILVS
jgi:Fe-S cluster biogenesis protein NfuA